MSEEKGRYEVTPKPGVIRTSCFLRYDDGWTVPTGPEVREMLRRLDMSGDQVANFVGVSISRTARKWQAEDIQNTAKIPYVAWQLLCWSLKEIDPSISPPPFAIQDHGWSAKKMSNME